MPGEGSAKDLWGYLMGEEGLDSAPGTRGTTLVSAAREECAWPGIRDHGLLLIWDKREDRLVARILPNKALVKE